MRFISRIFALFTGLLLTFTAYPSVATSPYPVGQEVSIERCYGKRAADRCRTFTDTWGEYHTPVFVENYVGELPEQAVTVTSTSPWKVCVKFIPVRDNVMNERSICRVVVGTVTLPVYPTHLDFDYTAATLPEAADMRTYVELSAGIKCMDADCRRAVRLSGEERKIAMDIYGEKMCKGLKLGPLISWEEDRSGERGFLSMNLHCLEHP